MRKFLLSLATGSFLAFCLFSSVFAQPDPRDSVIIESKTIAPGVGSPAAVVGVYITNKDTLANITLALVERSVSGGAYMTLAWPRNFDGVISSYNSSLKYIRMFVSNRYDGVSPDTFTMTTFFDPTDISGTAEPPNLARKRFLEIRFDSIWNNSGMVDIDSADIRGGDTHTFTCFVGLRFPRLGADTRVNFVKGVITIAEPARGDMDGNGEFTMMDVILLTNCVFLEGVYQKRADVNCDGTASPADVATILRKVFQEYALPQCPS